MTRGQKKRLFISAVLVVLVLASILPAFTAVSVRWAQMGIATGAELYRYVQHDHDWAAEIAVAEAEVASRNDLANWYVGLEHWDRVIVALASWGILVFSVVFLYNVVTYEINYQEKKKRTIKVRPVAY